jgi:hypothetical protein
MSSYAEGVNIIDLLRKYRVELFSINNRIDLLLESIDQIAKANQ